MSDSNSTAQGRRQAGLLDIRNIIGGLLGVYAVILVLMGLFGDEQGDKTGDVNANLWAGLVMFVMSAIFLVWARLRPVVVPADPETEPDAQDGAA